MTNFTVFLAFELDCDTSETARKVARAMVEGKQEFPDEVSCVGFEYSPVTAEHLAVALIVLGKSMQEIQEDEAHAFN